MSEPTNHNAPAPLTRPGAGRPEGVDMATIEDHERVIAQLISGSLDGRSWRDLTPRLIAEHLVANGVRYVLDPERYDAEATS